MNQAENNQPTNEEIINLLELVRLAFNTSPNFAVLPHTGILEQKTSSYKIVSQVEDILRRMKGQ